MGGVRRVGGVEGGGWGCCLVAAVAHARTLVGWAMMDLARARPASLTAAPKGARRRARDGARAADWPSALVAVRVYGCDGCGAMLARRWSLRSNHRARWRRPRSHRTKSLVRSPILVSAAPICHACELCQKQRRAATRKLKLNRILIDQPGDDKLRDFFVRSVIEEPPRWL